jgi:molybdopterin synthase catalytic subunit
MNTQTMIELTGEPIDTQAILQSVHSPGAGAMVLFVGTTREMTADRRTDFLRYECYEEMARAKLGGLADDALERWPLIKCAIVHRLGRVEVGETSVAIAVSAAHRRPAFDAGQWLIDRIKDVVPIWKQENWADGTSQWVHPGLDVPSESPGETSR